MMALEYVRPYTKEDHLACEAIFRSNTPLYFDESEMAGLDVWLKGKDQGSISYAGNMAEYFFILEKDKKVLACGGYYVTASKKVNLVWGMVLCNQQGKGFGNALLVYRIRHIQLHFPHHQIILDTSQHSYRFFQKKGFSLVKISENTYGKGLHRYDMTMDTDRS